MAETTRRERLIKELIRVRDLAGISGRALAEKHLDISQGTQWRIEHGQALPSMPVVRQWLDACAVSGSERQRLLELAEAVHGETRPWRELLRGAKHLQGEARSRERVATRVRNFQPTIVPGLLQTPEYATHLLPLADITGATDHAAAVEARLQRQKVLYDETRRFQFVMTEQVLRWSPGPPSLLAAQVDRIASLAGLDTVDVAVLPAAAAVAVPWHNFVIWEPDGEEPFVTTELVHGEQELHNDDEVSVYTQLWDRLWSSAVVGDEAVALIRRGA
jgi:transcriptional regulator with XRE-family HTH domain